MPETSADRPETAPPQPGRTALVLDAGGARSAYQVGALEVLLPALAEQGRRPEVMVGTSAGALLTAGLAATAHLEVDEQVRGLRDLLHTATKDHVIRPLWQQLPAVALRYASETLGTGLFRLRGLLGTEPLARTLGKRIDWQQLHRNLAEGRVDVAAVCATSVRAGRVTFFTETGRGWRDPLPAPAAPKNRGYVGARLDVPHLMASAAIPALFPSVEVQQPEEAAGWYVDGATRRRVPLAPAVELGAERMLAVGVGSIHPAEADPDRDAQAVDLGDGAATLLGAVMDDPFRNDLRRFAEVNALVDDPDVGPALATHREAAGRRPYRSMPHAAVAPRHGDEIAEVAMEVYRRNHGSIRGTASDPDLQLIHRLLGSDSPLQGELLSYLLFDRDFFDEVAALGHRDARAWMERHPDLWTTGPAVPGLEG